MTNNKLFRSWVAWLRLYFPMQLVVKASIVPDEEIPGHDGLCIYQEYLNRKPHIFIKVAASLDETNTRETLFEEWAHGIRHHIQSIGDPEGHDGIYKRIFKKINQSWRIENGEE